MTTTVDVGISAPGWRRDPGNPRHITYWNGARWTVHMRWDGADWHRCEEPHEPPPPPAPMDALGPTVVADPVTSAPGALGEPPAATPVVTVGTVGTVGGAGVETLGPTATPTSPTPARRPRGRLYGLLAVLVLVVGGGAGYYVVSHRTTTTGTVIPPAAPSAAQVLERSLVAARSQPSVHLVSSESEGGVEVSGTYDVAATKGQETIDGGSAGNAAVLEVSGAAYMRADAAFLQNSLGLSAAAAARGAGQWVEFQPGDNGFAQVSSGLTLHSALLEAAPTGALRLARGQTVDGQRVVAITGGLPRDSVSGAVGTQVLYLEAAAPYLPVELELTGSVHGQHATSTVTFSQWGEPLTVTAPTGVTPAAALGS